MIDYQMKKIREYKNLRDALTNIANALFEDNPYRELPRGARRLECEMNKAYWAAVQAVITTAGVSQGRARRIVERFGGEWGSGCFYSAQKRAIEKILQS